MPNLQDLFQRVEHLLLRHAELQRTHQLLQQQMGDLTAERDALRQKLAAARTRLDALIARLPTEGSAPPAGGEGRPEWRNRVKQVEVTILGQSYLLGCPADGEAALLQAVAMVDREMSGIRDAGKVKARERMAVLAALNLAFRLAERDADDGAAAVKEVASRPGSTSGSGSTAASAGADVQGQAPDGQEAQALLAGLHDVDLDGLMRRLDEVLAEDGRLL